MSLVNYNIYYLIGNLNDPLLNGIMVVASDFQVNL